MAARPEGESSDSAQAASPVPTQAPLAPAASTAARLAAEPIPPAASTGTSTAARTASNRGSVAMVTAPWPPPSDPRATSTSMPASAARRACSAVKTWVAVRIPRSCARDTQVSSSPNETASRAGRASSAAASSAGRRAATQSTRPMPNGPVIAHARSISRCRASGVAALPMPIMPSPPAAVTAAASAPPATPPIGAWTTGTRRPKARDHGVASGSAGRMSVVSRAVGTALCQHSAEPARRPAPRPSENVAQDTNDGSLSAIVHCQSNRSTGHRRRHPDRGRVVPGQATAVRSPDRTFPARSTMYPGAHVDTFPDKPALIMAGSGETLTYRELEDNSVRLARHLHEAGLRRGDHLALLSGNDPKVYEVYWAALRSGLYITAVNRHLSPAEIAYIVDDCGAKALIVAADLSEAAQAVAEQTPKVRVRIAYGGAVPGHDSYEQAL